MYLTIIIGACLSIVGVLGLFWCIRLVLIARKTAKSEDDMRKTLQKVVALNFAALGISTLGLIAVVFGIFLT
ncbi:MAG: hypothetical protein ACI9O0_000957 [Paracoccaceae bacterium]|jgi:hypothetical protein